MSDKFTLVKLPEKIPHLLQILHLLKRIKWSSEDVFLVILYYKIRLYVYVCLSTKGCLNHAYYGDETFTGDSMGLGEGWWLHFILKELFSGTF